MLKVKPGARDIMFRRKAPLTNTPSASFIKEEDGRESDTQGGDTGAAAAGGGGLGGGLPRPPLARGEMPFPPLQRRWTFSGGQEESQLFSALLDMPPTMYVSPEKDLGSANASRDSSRHGVEEHSHSRGSGGSIKRELHKASVAQELSDAVLDLMMMSGSEWGLAGTYQERESSARSMIKEHFKKLPSRYALSVDANVVLKDMRLMAEVRKQDRVSVDVEKGEWDSTENARSVITLSCRDRPNLLDTITRIISRLSSTIMDADCMTSKDGLTLDRFVVEHKDLAKVSGAGKGKEGEVDSQALKCVLESMLNGVDSDIATLSPSRLLRASSPAADQASAPPSVAQQQQQQQQKGLSEETIPFEELELGEVVGSGQSGSLYRATWKGRTVAVKMVKKPDASDENVERFLADFERERNIMRGIRHPNLCRFYGVSIAPAHCCLVYSFLEGGSLAELLRDRSKRYDLFGLALDIAQGMDYLHKRGAMHRDLKSDNIMLDTDGRAVIADFGLVCPTITVHDHTGETGTYRWMAPEVIRHEPYSTAADVYSFGIVLWELLTRERPFKGMTPIQAAFAVARQGYRPTLPSQTPQPLADLIRACWHEDQMRRPTFGAIIQALTAIRRQLLGA